MYIENVCVYRLENNNNNNNKIGLGPYQDSSISIPLHDLHDFSIKDIYGNPKYPASRDFDYSGNFNSVYIEHNEYFACPSLNKLIEWFDIHIIDLIKLNNYEIVEYHVKSILISYTGKQCIFIDDNVIDKKTIVDSNSIDVIKKLLFNS